MTGQNRSKIDWKTIFAGVGTLGAVMVAILEFSAASNADNEARHSASEMRICRLEAVEGIGICKR